MRHRYIDAHGRPGVCRLKCGDHPAGWLSSSSSPYPRRHPTEVQDTAAMNYSSNLASGLLATPQAQPQLSLPLSAAQAEVWLAETLNPGTTQYNIAEYLEIHGAVDAALFERALRQVVAEAEALNVRFVDAGDGSRQILSPVTDFPLPVLDVSAEADPCAAAEAWMEADLARVRDLGRDGLFAHALFIAGPERAFWYQGYHHIVADGFSRPLIARRLAAVYTALVDGRLPEPNPFGSLRDLLEADAAYHASDAVSRDRDYWTARFADQPAPVSLATSAAIPSGRFLRQTGELPQATLEALRAAASPLGTTWPRVVIAVMAAYMHRLTGAEEIILGLPVTARSNRSLRNIPGMVSNVVPLRLAMTPEMPLTDLFGQVGLEVRQALHHQRYRGEALRRDLRLTGLGQQIHSLSVNIMAFDYDLSFAGAPATVHNLSNGPVVDLSLAVYERADGQGLQLAFDANPAIYTAEELAAHSARLVRLLEVVAADPARPIGSIDLLDPAE
ncbi:MAG: hypothetical protein E5W94_04830, partial [Mesorhizobium sp.]